MENGCLRRSEGKNACGRTGAPAVGKSHGLWATDLSPHAVHRSVPRRPHRRARRPQLSTEACTAEASECRPQTVYDASFPQPDRGKRWILRLVGRRRCLWSIEDPQITRMSQLTGGLWMTVDNSAHMLCTTVCARDPARRGGVREGSIHRMMHPGGHLCGSVWIAGRRRAGVLERCDHDPRRWRCVVRYVVAPQPRCCCLILLVSSVTWL